MQLRLFLLVFCQKVSNKFLGSSNSYPLLVAYLDIESSNSPSLNTRNLVKIFPQECTLIQPIFSVRTNEVYFCLDHSFQLWQSSDTYASIYVFYYSVPGSIPGQLHTTVTFQLKEYLNWNIVQIALQALIARLLSLVVVTAENKSFNKKKTNYQNRLSVLVE